LTKSAPYTQVKHNIYKINDVTWWKQCNF